MGRSWRQIPRFRLRQALINRRDKFTRFLPRLCSQKESRMSDSEDDKPLGKYKRKTKVGVVCGAAAEAACGAHACV
jgi:hypothetical protein